MKVDVDELTRFIHREIDNYDYVVPGGALGKPWPQEKVDHQLAQLRSSLVAPYAVTVEQRDTIEQIDSDPAILAEVLVVADDGSGFLVFYDPIASEFGLAQGGLSDKPVTIGVRGDVVGVFMSR